MLFSAITCQRLHNARELPYITVMQYLSMPPIPSPLSVYV